MLKKFYIGLSAVLISSYLAWTLLGFEQGSDKDIGATLRRSGGGFVIPVRRSRGFGFGTGFGFGK